MKKFLLWVLTLIMAVMFSWIVKTIIIKDIFKIDYGFISIEYLITFIVSLYGSIMTIEPHKG